MSDYIIHNIEIEVDPKLDFNNDINTDKPVETNPNYYIGKAIGEKGSKLNLYRPRRGQDKEEVPNWVLRNENGIALIRIHNKENYKLYDLQENSESVVKDCVRFNQNSYPFGYVIIDYRDGRCQIAIEKTSSWDGKTETICNSIQEFFAYNKYLCGLGITVKSIEKKTIAIEFSKFIDKRTVDHGDVLESFTFKLPDLNRQPTTRVPESLSEQINFQREYMKYYGGIGGEITTIMKQNANYDNLKQLAYVVTMCVDNTFDLSVKFRDYGAFSCKEGVVAKYAMNEIVISNFKDFITPESEIPEHSMEKWLDYVYEDIIRIEERRGDEIPAKPKK